MPKLSALVPEGRWSVEEARAVLAAVERSGLSIQRFATEQGLVAERLYRWKRKLREVSAVEFAEVTAPTTPTGVEVVLQTGVVLRVPESSSVHFVGCLVAAIERESAC